jgi:hypothetical protein
MTPQEDVRVLLALVDRHLRALRLNLDPAYPDEGFTRCVPDLRTAARPWQAARRRASR